MGCVLSCSLMFTRCIYSELTVVTIKLRKVNKKPQAKNTSLEVILLLIIVIFSNSLALQFVFVVGVHTKTIRQLGLVSEHIVKSGWTLQLVDYQLIHSSSSLS